MYKNGIKQERTGWRDEWISQRHRTWSRNLPVLDLDCVLTTEGEEMGEQGWFTAEYNYKKPVALIEYKAYGARIDPTDANNSTIKALADMAGLPAFLVVYNKETLKFGVLPLNKTAEGYSATQVYTEQEYEALLKKLRTPCH